MMRGVPAAGRIDHLLAEARACTRCATHLPLGPRPLVRGNCSARLLIISQAPGIRAHRSGVSFDDRSGERLRDWLGLDRAQFYDEARIAIMPIGFCYPGRDHQGGDRPPRPECAPLWHPQLRPLLTAVRLTLLVGSYAVRFYLPESRGRPLAETLGRWREFRYGCFVLPHPSWRSAIFERRNPWFAAELLPELRAAVAAALAG